MAKFTPTDIKPHIDTENQPSDWRPLDLGPIDAYRKAVAQNLTTPDQFWERVDLMWAFLIVLQRLHADLTSTYPILDELENCPVEEEPDAACKILDAGMICLNGIYAGSPVVPDPAAEPTGKLPETDTSDTDLCWRMYGGDSSHTACVRGPGPQRGEVSWRFPTGLGWYVKPLVADGRVFVPSPGMRHRMWCLDLEDGGCLWRTTRQRTGRPRRTSHILPQAYTLTGAASTPVLAGGTLLVAELGAQGLNCGERGILKIDPESGESTGYQTIGHADYRTGYARFAGNAEFCVYTDGNQRIESSPPQCMAHNKLVCCRTQDLSVLWEFPVGQTWSNPVIDGDRVLTGSQDGLVYALNLPGDGHVEHFGRTDTERLAWLFSARGAVNSAIEPGPTCAFFGANSGDLYAVDKESGSLVWKRYLEDPEERAFQQFSKPLWHDGIVYVGSVANALYALDGQSGELIWKATLPDWVRSSPVVINQTIWVATLDGSLTAFDLSGKVRSVLKLSDFGFFADLVAADGKLLATDGSLNLHCLDAGSGKPLWDHRLLEHVRIHGQPVRTDEMACGGFYQSKPTVCHGMAFIGTPSRFVYAVDTATGKEQWKFEMGGAISGAPALSPPHEPHPHGLVLIGQQGGEDHFYGLDAITGRPVWKQALGWVWSSATLADGRAYIPCCDGYFTCLDVATGHIHWRYRSGRAASPESPVDEGRVFFGSWDHFVYALSSETGELLWKFFTGGSPDSGAPIAANGRLYLPMGGKRLCCLNAATGDVLWEIQPEKGCMNASPALAGDDLIISVSTLSGFIPPSAEIQCLDARSGRIKWTYPGGGITGPSVAGKDIFFASTAHTHFTSLDTHRDQDGQPTVNWSLNLGDRVFESVPAIAGGMAYILSDNGYLTAIV